MGGCELVGDTWGGINVGLEAGKWWGGAWGLSKGRGEGTLAFSEMLMREGGIGEGTERWGGMGIGREVGEGWGLVGIEWVKLTVDKTSERRERFSLSKRIEKMVTKAMLSSLSLSLSLSPSYVVWQASLRHTQRIG